MAKEYADQVQRNDELLRNDRDFFRERQKKYYDKRRTESPPIAERHSVYLTRRNLKTTRPSDKLNVTKIGPFPGDQGQQQSTRIPCPLEKFRPRGRHLGTDNSP